MSTTNSRSASFSIPSIIAVLAGILTFKVGAVLGLVLAGLAIVAGLVGVLLSLSPRTRGGFLSVLGVIGGLIGIVAAIVKAVMWFT